MSWSRAVLKALEPEMPCDCGPEWRGKHAPECIRRHLTPEEVVALVRRGMEEYGFFVVWQSRCWCEGKAEGSEHTPGCPGIAQDEKMQELWGS